MKTVVLAMKWPSLIVKKRKKYALMKKKSLVGSTAGGNPIKEIESLKKDKICLKFLAYALPQFILNNCMYVCIVTI